MLQRLTNHTLQYGRLFIVLCGSYMGFMEKEEHLVFGAGGFVFRRVCVQVRKREIRENRHRKDRNS